MVQVETATSMAQTVVSVPWRSRARLKISARLLSWSSVRSTTWRTSILSLLCTWTMVEVVIPTFRIAQVVYEPTTAQPMPSEPSTQICASTTWPPCQTETSRTWRRQGTRETFCRTLRIDLTTSSAATMPSSRTIRTCSMRASHNPSKHRKLRMVRCSATLLRRFKKNTSKEFTARAKTTLASSLKLKMAKLTTPWKPTLSRTTACKSQPAISTCRSEQ